MPSHLSLAEHDPPRFEHSDTATAPASALDAMFRRHQGWLLALLRFRYGAELAEDLLQETFLRAAQQNRAHEVRHPRAWLATIALNAARDRRRKAQTRAHLSAPDPLLPAPVRGGAPQHNAVLLKQIVLDLPPHLRDVFVLSRFGGLTYEEIARRLSISIKTVEWRMTRALAICADQLGD